MNHVRFNLLEQSDGSFFDLTDAELMSNELRYPQVVRTWRCVAAGSRDAVLAAWRLLQS